VTDITYIKTHEGFLFLAVVMDLFARNIVGWSMSERMPEDLAMQAIAALKPNRQYFIILRWFTIQLGVIRKMTEYRQTTLSVNILKG